MKQKATWMYDALSALFSFFQSLCELHSGVQEKVSFKLTLKQHFGDHTDADTQ